MNVKSPLKDFVYLIFLFIYCFLSVRTVFCKGLPPAFDHPVHIAYSAFYVQKCKFQDIFLYYYPLNLCGAINVQPHPMTYMLIYIVNLIFNDFIFSYKFALFLTYLLLSTSMYISCRALGLGCLSSLFSSLLFSTAFGYEALGLASSFFFYTFYTGMWSDVLAISLFPLATMLFHFALRSNNKLFFSSLSSILVSAIILSHPSFSLPLLFMFFIESLLYNPKKSIIIFFFISSSAIAVSSPLLLVNIVYLKSYYPFNTVYFLWRYPFSCLLKFSFTNAIPIIFLPMCLIGTLYSIRFEKHFIYIPVWILCVLSIMSLSSIIGIDELKSLGFFKPIISGLLYGKYVAIMRFILSLLSGLGFEYFLSITSSRKHLIILLSVFTPLLLSQLLYTDLGYPILHDKIIKMDEDYPLFHSINDIFLWIKENQPIEYRIAPQSLFGYSYSASSLADLIKKRSFPCFSHYLSLIPLKSGKSMLGDWPAMDILVIPLSLGCKDSLLGLTNKDICQNPELLASRMRELGVNSVIVYSEDLISTLRGHSLFIEVYSNDFFHVFTLVNSSSVIASNNGVINVKSIEYVRQGIVIRLSSSVKQSIILKLLYYPNIACRVNGSETSIEIYNSPVGLPFIVLSIPKSENLTIELKVETPLPLKIVMFFSFSYLFLLLLSCLLSIKSKIALKPLFS